MSIYKKDIVYLRGDDNEWIEIGDIYKRLDKLEKQVAVLVNKIQDEKK